MAGKQIIFGQEQVIDEALGNPETTRSIGVSARKTIYLSWDDIAKASIERYAALIEKNSKTPRKTILI